MVLLRAVGRNATRKAGFSLTELLVVSAVISVLAGLLLPALGRAREKARQAVCVGNLRQIGQAALLYQHDYGRLPTSPFAGYLLWNGVDYLLYGRLVPYCGTALAKSFYCPSADLFTMYSQTTGLANLGVPGRTTAGSYYVRSFAQGAQLQPTARRRHCSPTCRVNTRPASTCSTPTAVRDLYRRLPVGTSSLVPQQA